MFPHLDLKHSSELGVTNSKQYLSLGRSIRLHLRLIQSQESSEDPKTDKTARVTFLSNEHPTLFA